MAQAGQQAAGAAVGAAIGAFVGGPPGAVAGGALGAGAVGSLQQKFIGDDQTSLDEAALKVNLEQARLSAAEKSAVVARNFRKALASQVAIASMRGGAGSLALQFGNEAYQNFLQDQKAIDTGLQIAETQGKITEGDIKVKQQTSDLRALTTFASTAFSGINFSNLLKGSGK